MNNNYVAMDPELARRKEDVSSDADPNKLTVNEEAEKEEVNHITTARERYQKDRISKEKEWTESFKMYMSFVDRNIAPFLSNLFIPKTHEAVELLSAYLIGTNQSISTFPENGTSNPMKAKVAGRWLDLLWRKTLKARLKVLVWIKQSIVFGNGIMKFGYDNEKKKPWMMVCAIEDVYFDFFEQEIQDSEYVIHEVRRDPNDVKTDAKYDLADKDGKLIREQAIEGAQSFSQADVLFSSYDGSLVKSENKGKVLIMEVWCTDEGKQTIKTLIPTKLGWRVARRAENPNKYKNGEQFRPFSKAKFKVSPLPNRAYDTGAVWPTVKIQKAFNDLSNEYFDAVAILNTPMWIKRRGARINPAELIRRPGGVITVGDITKDLKFEQTGDVKQSIIEMLNRLDKEFQSASMISALLQQFSNTATGDSLEQVPLQTLRDMIDKNIADALSEAGQMVLAISLSHTSDVQSIVLYENDDEVATLEFNPADIDGMHEVIITPDRPSGMSKAVQNKQLLDFLTISAPDVALQQKYPSLREKVYKQILENGGIGDTDYFFADEGPIKSPLQPDATGKLVEKTDTGTGLKEGNIINGANKVQ